MYLQSRQFSIYKRNTTLFNVVKREEILCVCKNLSSAYFKDRPDTTRAQLPIKDEFSEIKESAYPFIFLGYDRINDVLVCWNFHIAKND